VRGVSAGDVVAERFELLSMVARTGDGSRWRAADRERGGAAVTLEVFRSTTADLDLLARLDHPNITAHVAHGDGWLATEWLQGVDLEQALARRRPSTAEALRLGACLADALAHAHRCGVAHGQLEPALVLLVDGDIERPKVCGFGRGPRSQRDCAALGGLGYMAPELARGWRASPAADVFSLGCVLYRALGGRAAFEGDSVGALVVAVLTGDPPRLGTLVPIPGRLEALIHSMLAKDPAARPGDLAEVRAALLEAVDGGCPSEALLADYLAGAAGTEAREAMERHLDRCGDCTRLVADFAKSTRAGAPPASTGAASLGIGAKLGRYAIEDVLGMGAVGIVYLARDLQLHRPVALKVVLHTHRSDRAHARILREARALAQLSHPNVVAVYDTGHAGDRPYLVLEYVPGLRFDVWIRQRVRARQEVAAFLLQAGEGLAAAHDAGLVHRDVKPANVMVGDDGRVRVVDFGLVRIDPDDPKAGFQTTVGAYLGTPYYMAPEQRYIASVDVRADQYAFCVMASDALYRGGRPGGDALHMPLVDPNDAVLAVLRRGLMPLARDRHPTMHALLAELRAALASELASDAAPATVPMPPDPLPADAMMVLLARPPAGPLAEVPLRDLTHTLAPSDVESPTAEAARELAARAGAEANVLPNGLLLARFRADARFRESPATRAAQCALALSGVLGVPEVAVVAEEATASDVRAFGRAQAELERAAPGTVRLDERVAASVQHEVRVERDPSGWLLHA
jgi:serine/threonine-protein kinase